MNISEARAIVRDWDENATEEQKRKADSAYHEQMGSYHEAANAEDAEAALYAGLHYRAFPTYGIEKWTQSERDAAVLFNRTRLVEETFS